jgi:gliding motility-associated-like protein
MKIRLLLLFVVVPLLTFCQKQGNVWYFSGNNGLDFNSGSPVLLTNGQLPTGGEVEGAASISDSSGNLLFYATAKTIWNKNHQIMLNGNNLAGGLSSTQGVFIVPLPKSNSIFYVFTLDDMQNCFEKGLRYSIINLCLDDSLGAIETSYKNIPLLDSAGEKMAATYHANGTDIWLVVHKYFSNAFYSFLITENGITDIIVSHIGSHHPADLTTNCVQAIGQMKISPNGTKLALVNKNAFTVSIAELFDFDNNTGVVSNSINLQPNLNLQYYGVSFSPDNSKLYISSDYELYQYNLNAGVSASIVSSKTLIHSGGNPLTVLQLGPDRKLYVNLGSNYLAVVMNPNELGTACGYIHHAIDLINTVAYFSPSFIDSYKYHNQLACTDYVPIEPPITELKVPNIFTPNADNINDTFIIENLPADATVHIYNRWGALVAEWNKPDGSWDGRTKGGSQVSAGVYYYIVTLQDGERRKGFVEVIK